MKKPQIGVGKQTRQSSTPKRLLLNLFMFGVIMLLVSAGTTQYLAHQFGYHAGLPGHLTGKFYLPWSWVSWAWSYWNTYTKTMETAIFIFSGGTIAALSIYAFGLMAMRRQSKGIDSLHGSAHWASRDEIVESGLLPLKPGGDQEGVYVGAWANPKTEKTEYLRHNGPEHVLAFAPTRSGKGVGLVLPTLLSWPHSAIVYDIKGENYAISSGWRKEYAGNIILKFDPTAIDDDDGNNPCARFNPLSEIRLGTENEIRDTQNIAALLVDPDGKGMEDHWSKTAYSLMTALILHICYVKKDAENPACMGDIDKALTESSEDVDAVFQAMKAYQHTPTGPHELVAKEAEAMIKTPEKERGSIISTAISFLKLYNDPTVRENVSGSHWKITDLMNHEQPVSLYLVVSPSDSARLRPLIRLMISMIVNRLTESMQFENGTSVQGYEHRMLVMLDEFASLKRMTTVEDALSYAAGYGLKFYLIVQDLQQIVKQYTREEGLTGNCHIRIAYAPNKLDTAELLSKMSGIMTIIKESITESGKRHSWMLSSTSRTYNETQRPLITADEAMRLPAPEKTSDGKIKKPGDMLIFAAGYAPVYGEQILYFLDEVFSARSKVPTPQLSDRIRHQIEESPNAVKIDEPEPEEQAPPVTDNHEDEDKE